MRMSVIRELIETNSVKMEGRYPYFFYNEKPCNLVLDLN